MYSRDAQEKFIELRAQGWTLGHIASEIHISKRTLVDWNRQYAADIQTMRGVELELLKEKFLASREEDLERLRRLQKDIADELANRTLKFVDTEKLFRLSVDLRQEIQGMIREANREDESLHPAANGQPRGMSLATNGNGHH